MNNEVLRFFYQSTISKLEETMMIGCLLSPKVKEYVHIKNSSNKKILSPYFIILTVSTLLSAKFEAQFFYSRRRLKETTFFLLLIIKIQQLISDAVKSAYSNSGSMLLS